MKRFALAMLSLSALFVLFFTSCETDNEDYYLNTQTIYYSVDVNEWKVIYDEWGKYQYLYCTFREPYLTRNVYENGMIVAYMRFDDGQLSPLPFSDFWVDSNGYKWEEQVTCEIEPGQVTFIFKADDHGDVSYNYDFVLKLMW
jgi:hypothetical protein